MIRFLLSFLASAAVAFVSVLPLCGLVFDCGCTLTHGLEYCNIHNPSGPHCPWCSYGSTTFWALFAIMLAGTALTIGASLHWIRSSLWVGLLSGLLAFSFWASIIGLASALYSAYPTFFGLRNFLTP